MAFSKKTCLEKERVRSKVPPRKVGVGLKRSGELIAPINSRLNMVVRYPTPFGLGRNGRWLSRGSSYPGLTSGYIVVICCCDDRLLSRAVICGHTV